MCNVNTQMSEWPAGCNSSIFKVWTDVLYKAYIDNNISYKNLFLPNKVKTKNMKYNWHTQATRH